MKKNSEIIQLRKVMLLFSPYDSLNLQRHTNNFYKRPQWSVLFFEVFVLRNLIRQP